MISVPVASRSREYSRRVERFFGSPKSLKGGQEQAALDRSAHKYPGGGTVAVL